MDNVVSLEQNIEHFSNIDNIWDTDSLVNLRQYLLSFEKLPSYKKLLRAMIKFDDMYRQLYVSPKKSFYAKGYKEIVEEENVYRAQRRAQVYMNRRKLIKTVDQKNEKRIVVTSSGEKIFYKDFPLAKLRKKKWDQLWTIVMYDFPEKIRGKRDDLRRKLTYYDFGSPQISIFISPLPLAEPIQQFIEAERYERYVWVTRARAVLGKSNQEIARAAWPIGLLNDLYKRLYGTFPKIKKDENLVVFWKTCFLALDNQDPYLPFELLPERWWGTECRKLFNKATGGNILRSIFAKITG